MFCPVSYVFCITPKKKKLNTQANENNNVHYFSHRHKTDEVFWKGKSVTIYFRQQNDDINYRYYIFNKVYFHKQAYLPVFNKRID